MSPRQLDSRPRAFAFASRPITKTEAAHRDASMNESDWQGHLRWGTPGVVLARGTIVPSEGCRSIHLSCSRR